MNALGKMTWVELKLFLRDPLTVVFTLALPLILLFILAGVFGNTPNEEELVYRGVGAMDFYVPAYLALLPASIGVVSLPAHLAGYRERGVLRRFHASAGGVGLMVGAQILVAVLVASVASLVLWVAAAPVYDVRSPEAPLQVLAAFILVALTFAAVGMLLGAVMPTARAAQGAGIILWFIMLLIGGAGPPPEVLTGAMRTVGDLTPLQHAVILLQDPWLGFGWNWEETLIVSGVLVVGTLLAWRLFRWE